MPRLPAVLALCIACSPCAAAPPPPATQRVYTAQVPEEVRNAPGGGLTHWDYMTSVYVLGIAIIVSMLLLLFGLGILMYKTGKTLNDQRYFQLAVLLVIAGFGAVLPVIGFSSGQVAGLYGMFGLVLGHIFTPRGRQPPTPPGRSTT